MGRYADIAKDVYSVFSTLSWTSQNIKTFPNNYTGATSGSSHIRVSILPSGNSINLKSLSGILHIDIFVASGIGPSEYMNIADKLDTYLQAKTINVSSGNTQFGISSMSVLGKEKEADLYRALYTIPFNYFGVS